MVKASETTAPPPGSSNTLKRNSRLSRFFHKLQHPTKRREGSSAAPAAPDQQQQQPQHANGTEHSKLDSIRSHETDGADPSASIRPITPSSLGATSSSMGPTSAHPSSASPGADASSSSRRPASHPSTHSVNSHSTEDAATYASSSHASTKPTTVMSVDPGAGGNRIAQPPIPSPSSTNGIPSELAQPGRPGRRTGRTRPDSAAAVQTPAHTRTHSSSNTNPASNSNLAPPINIDGVASPPKEGDERQPTEKETKYGTVPKYSTPHPSQNPHPSGIPTDNASILTLASSGFAPSSHAVHNLPPDEDASVRALAPSRRESAESLSSRWSAFPSSIGVGGTGPASLRAASGGAGGAVHPSALGGAAGGVLGGGSLLKSEVGGSSSGSSVANVAAPTATTDGQAGVEEVKDHANVGPAPAEDHDQGGQSPTQGLVTAPTSPAVP